ncbi:hypothetical protein COBT_001145 [Conglomerata obtusa]
MHNEANENDQPQRLNTRSINRSEYSLTYVTKPSDILNIYHMVSMKESKYLKIKIRNGKKLKLKFTQGGINLIQFYIKKYLFSWYILMTRAKVNLYKNVKFSRLLTNYMKLNTLFEVVIKKLGMHNFNRMNHQWKQGGRNPVIASDCYSEIIVWFCQCKISLENMKHSPLKLAYISKKFKNAF